MTYREFFNRNKKEIEKSIKDMLPDPFGRKMRELESLIRNTNHCDEFAGYHNRAYKYIKKQVEKKQKI